MSAGVRPERKPLTEIVADLRGQGLNDAEVEEVLVKHYGATAEPAAPTSAPRFQSTPKPSTSTRENLGRAAIAATQGGTLGFADELAARSVDLVRRATGGRLFGNANYEAMRDDVRGRAAAFRSEHPVYSVAAETGGALATTLPAAAASATARGLTLAGRMVQGAKVGAGTGAVAGVGNADGGLTERVTGGVVGGTLGAAIGANLPVAGAAAGRAVTALGLRPTGRTAEEIAGDAALMRAPRGVQANASNTPTVAQASPANASGPTLGQRFRAATGRTVERSTGIESSKDRALREVEQAMRLDNVTPADAIALARANPTKPIAVLDLGEGNVAGLARMSKDTPGVGRQRIPRFLKDRSAGPTQSEAVTLGRVTNDFERRIGLAPENYFQSADDMARAQKQAAAADYGAIRNRVVDDDEVLAFLNEPEVRNIHGRLQRNARLGGGDPVPDLVTTTRIGEQDFTSLNPQTLGTIDKIKRQLDQIIKRGGDGAPIDRDGAYELRGRLNRILDRLDTEIPEYGKARAKYRGSAEAQEAFAAGRDDFLSLDPRLIAGKLASLPEASRDLYRRGGYDALRSKLLRMKDGANVGEFLESNPDIRDRVAALAKQADDVPALRGDLQIERAMGDRKNQVLGGPNTAERLIEHWSRVPAVTHVGRVVRKIPVLGEIGGAAVDNALTRRMSEQTGEVMGEVSRIMTRTGADGMELLAREIEELALRDAARSARSGVLGGTSAAQLTGKKKR